MPKARDLTGQTFGELIAIRPEGKDVQGKNTWLFSCSCGQLTVKTGTDVTRGRIKSCGHLNYPTELRGQTFGKLTPLFPSGKRVQRALVWVCSCECGGITEVPTSRLKNGHTQSCGCLNGYPERHGMGDRPEYKPWCSLAERGERPDEWKNFTQFLKDVGPRPTTRHTLHKYDAGQQHSSSNSYWAIRQEVIAERRSLGMPLDLGFNILDCLAGSSTESGEAASGATVGSSVQGGYRQASEGSGFTDDCGSGHYEDDGSVSSELVRESREVSTTAF